nr:RuBisCO long chain, Form III-b [uncultured archaeon]
MDLKYRPGKDDLVCLFYFELAKGMAVKEAVGRIASESSNGTWTSLSTLKEHIRKIRARAFEINGNYVKIAYPIELFELGSIPQLMSSVAGNIFGMKAVANLKLLDISFPEKYLRSFKGPGFGMNGIRKVMAVSKRPLTCTVPKPKVGMTTNEHLNVARDAWTGGIDFLKDDENLTDQNFNKFYKRADLCFKLRDKIEKITGERKSYFINVTAETNEMVKRAKHVADLGGEYVMIDFLTAGYSGFQTLRDFCHDHKLAIHVHRAMHAAFDRNPKHGISMLTLAKIVRLIGGDNLHIGTVVGKLVGSKSDVLMLKEGIVNQGIIAGQLNLSQKWHGMKDMIPVSSGGLHPGLVPYIMNILGNNCVLQLGGGIHGHPNGTKYGAIALRQAIDASLSKVNLTEYAKMHKELKIALGKWGFEKPI